MVTLSILGMHWCQHAGWMVVLYDGHRKRRLQITLGLEEALTLGQTLAGRHTADGALYDLVGTVLRRGDAHAARVALNHAGQRRATTSILLDGGDGMLSYPTSTAVGVALAVRAGLPLVADESLMEVCSVPEEPDDSEAADGLPEPTPIPRAFHLALVEPPEDDDA